jgi:predicted adenylyl cyclase CyaB
MPRNIEIKARIDDVRTLLPRARALADGEPELLVQDDTFFVTARGRLKLRVVEGDSAELIAYERADAAEARASDYVRVPVADAEGLREALARTLGVCGRVRKRRWLLRSGATRIHLDEVEGLGHFMELEVVMREGQADAEGAATAEALMGALGLAEAPRLATAYVDLLPAAAGALSLHP